MSIDVADIFRLLIPASFRGVQFWMVDCRVTAGRRVQKFLFPQRDDAAWEDLGALDGPMPINGILIGDDYVSQAQDMLTAWRQPGAAQLMHPWLGLLNVIMPQPGTLSFSQSTLRCVKLEFTVELFDPTKPAPSDTLSGILAAIQDVQFQVNGVLGAVLAPVQLTVAAIGAVEAVGGQLSGILGQVVGTAGAVFGAISGTLAPLQTLGALPLGIGYPAAVAAVLAAPFAAIGATSATLLTSAIGPGDTPPAVVAQDPRVTTAMLLAATTQISAIAAGPVNAAPVAALALAASGFAITAAIDAATDIVFTSQQDALSWLGQLNAGLDQVATQAIALAPFLPAAATPVWRSCQALRAAVAADISAQLGRLPTVQILTLAGTMPAWLVAQSLVGDNPAQLLGMYQDLVARNAVVYPLAVPPGQIEALVA